MTHPLMRHQIEGGEIPMSDFRRWCRIQVVTLLIAMPIATTCGHALLSMANGKFIVTWPGLVVFGLGLFIAGAWSVHALKGLWRMPDAILEGGIYADVPKVSPTVAKDQDPEAFDRAVA